MPSICQKFGSLHCAALTPQLNKRMHALVYPQNVVHGTTFPSQALFLLSCRQASPLTPEYSCRALMRRARQRYC